MRTGSLGGKVDMQSRTLSAIEAVSNLAAGFVISLVVQIVSFKCLGIAASHGQQLSLTIIFTGASLVRSYVLRRLFERFSWRS